MVNQLYYGDNLEVLRRYIKNPLTYVISIRLLTLKVIIIKSTIILVQKTKHKPKHLLILGNGTIALFKESMKFLITIMAYSLSNALI